MRTIQSLYRYPIKGLSPEPLQQVRLQPGKGFPLDREFALTNGSWDYDPATYRPRPKTAFLMLMQHERLASLRTRISEQDRTIQVKFPDGSHLAASLDDEAALQAIATTIGDHSGAPLRAAPRFVKASASRFTDVSVVSPALMNSISLINLASVRALGETMGVELDPLRFRANVYFDGGEPWEELSWIEREFCIGTMRARGVLRTRRCAATNVDPRRGVRDLGIPQALIRHFRHGDMGIYAELIEGGELRRGDPLQPPFPIPTQA